MEPFLNHNLEEYAFPDLYDAENDSFEPFGLFYAALAQRIGGAVLELGCGTGRFTIPMARQGINITGLDIAAGMLALAQRKSVDTAIQWVEADARSFALGRRFHFIFESGGMFQHLLERADQEAALSRVREHLEPEGRFLISSIFPNAELMATDETVRDWFSYTSPQGVEVRVSGTQNYDSLRQVRTETAIRRWHDAGGREIVHHAPLMLRDFFPQELETLLYYNGFEVVERFGDYDFSALAPDSPHIIYVCKLRA